MDQIPKYILDYIQQSEREDRAQMDEYLAARNAAHTAGKRPAPDADPHPQQGSNSRDNGPRVPFNISHGLITGCPICPQEDDFIHETPDPNLSRCSACKVVYYCSPSHQAADRPAHKTFCKRVQKATFFFEKEQAALKAYKGITDWRKVFETPLEDFWGCEQGRKYIRAGKEFVHELLRFNTKVAVEEALLWTLALMKLSPKDPLGLRCITPFLYIRTGRDQECYDFCKWWVTTGNNGGYDWQNPEASQESMKGSNVLEPVDVFQRARNSRLGVNTDNMPSISDLSHLVAVTLIKIRMRWGVRALRMGKIVTFQDHATVNLVWNTAKLRPGHEDEELVPLTAELEDHIALLFAWTDAANRHFWPALLNPGDHLTATPEYVRTGDETEMQMVLQESYNAFMETKSAFVLLKDVLEMSQDYDRQLSAMSPDPLCPWDRDPGYEDAPKNPFGPSNPNFWYWKGTRKYMYLRRDYAHEMVKLNTKTAIEHALDDTWALLRMDPEDHLGMRCIMPSLLLRLKRDRECYDFCKWWVTEGNDDNDWDWQSMDMPLTFEDAFESADMFERIRDYGSDPPMFSDLSFLLPILLLKIRMREDLESLRLGGNDSFPQWSLSTIVLDFHNDLEREDGREGEDYREGEEYSPLLIEVENQIRRLYRAVGRANKHFWPAFMNPWTHLEAKPSSYGLGDEAEMQIKLQECFNAWMETPEATGPIRDLMEGDDRYWYSMSGV
ncbi:uncharacterized protein J4E87_007065 [Alternaria ethzedia]|uniref:uncharacterized protein n=1 Tax=Alternaria ethzedia TaxID=181014 RepID=UPI0020C27ABF|nr:uncharacterized protein J4E87_007065 [Alternaria ethzedia]KAI4620737.1 hypothetical protein J4E87_007065 [Alternaria ethzedia]